ncbi:hypothetical protein NF27_BW00020 [Candidatus Jidaibacter acanthamoeba]|uniref:Uncharacterized protein n=1 Tax=Candidatus Jidaibacter acanthamoebae TaxID=86105 RepID=A0A0C1R199_9RICK|nr:hypothetical protein [Candidatus Jidaibacter acanthamoeba]KIE06055.1 hypothetical protein NF27_BW00020 [Candidatus Jidaibacter acanthamoeba]
MAKLANASSKLSKLSNLNEIVTDQQKDIGMVSKSKAGYKIKTFRLSNDDLKTLEKIREDVNGESRTSISDNKIIQALIYIGSKLESGKVLKAIKEMV